MSDESSKSALRRVFESVGYSLWTLLAGFLLPALILFFLLRELISSGVMSPAIDDPIWSLVLFAGQYILGLGILLLLPILIQKWTRQRIKHALGLMRAPAWKDVGTALIYFAMYLLVTTIVLALVQAFVPSIDLDQNQDVGFNNVTSVIGLIAAFLALVVMAPIAEELIFRGYLFGNIRPLIGDITSVIVTSALFGLVHGQWNVGIDVAILSVFLCMLRVKTGTVWAGIFLHMTKNGLAYFFLFVYPLLNSADLMKYFDK